MDEAQERTYRLFRIILRPFFEDAIDIEISGEKNIPEKGGYILVSNHRSDLDPLILSLVINRPINWLAGKYLYNMPIISDFLKGVGAISISRDEETKKTAFKEAEDVLKKEQLLGIFAEGWDSIGAEKKVSKFHTGFAQLALSTEIPIIPVGIISLKERKETFSIPEEWRKIWKFPKEMEALSKMIIYEEVNIKIGKKKKFKGALTYNKLKKVSEETRAKVKKLIGG